MKGDCHYGKFFKTFFFYTRKKSGKNLTDMGAKRGQILKKKKKKETFDDGIVVVAKSDERSVEIENILPLLQDRNDRMGQFDQQPVPLVGRRNRFECNAETTIDITSIN